MGAHSGKFGLVHGVGTVRNWSLNEISNPKNYVASNTRGGTGRTKGVSDFSGSFGRYGGGALLLPADVFDFEGYTAPEDDDEGAEGDGEIYAGPIIIDQVVITWNWTTNEIVSTVINFSGNGELTHAQGAPQLDETTPDIPSSSDAKITIGATDATVLCATQATLTLTSANQTHVDSCTNGWTERKAGIFDWTLSINVEENKRPNDIETGDDLELRLYIDAAAYWHLKWAHLGDFSNLTVDRETGAIVSQVANFAMNGFLDDEVGVVELLNAGGQVREWWPEPGGSS